MLALESLRRRIALANLLTPRLVFVSIILLAAFVRTWQIDLVEFKMDEAGWLSVASDLIDRGKIPQIGSVDPNTRNTIGMHIPPLMADVMALPLLVSRHPAFATAFVALANVLAVALVYWLTCRCFGRLEGQMATLLYAASTTATFYSRKIWSNYVLAPFVVLLFVTLFLLFIERRRWNLALALFLVSWIIQLHSSSLSMAFAFLIQAMLFHRELRWKPALVGLLAGIVLWVPYIVWIIENQSEDASTFLSFLSSQKAVIDLGAVRSAMEMVTTGGTEVSVSVQAPGWIPSFRGLFWFDYLYLTLLLTGIAIAVRKAASSSNSAETRKTSFLILLWVAMPLLFGIRHSIEIHRFYLLPLQPALFILMGISSAAVLRFLSRPSLAIVPRSTDRVPLPANGPGSKITFRLSRASSIVFFVALLIGVGSQTYLFMEFIHWTESGNTMKAFGYPALRYQLEATRRLSLSLSHDRPVVVVPNDTDTAKVFSYHLANRNVHFKRFNNGDTLMLPFGDGEAVYLVPGSEKALIRQLEASLSTAEWERVESGGRELQFVLIKGVQESLAAIIDGDDFRRLSVDFANGMRLIGYQLPNEAKGGQSLNGLIVVQLTEAVGAKDAADYHLFNHLLDASDNKVLQRDSSSLPVRDWQVGDVIAIPFALDLPPDLPPGPYRWRFGAYDLKTMKRVEMRDSVSGSSSDSVDLGPILLR